MMDVIAIGYMILIMFILVQAIIIYSLKSNNSQLKCSKDISIKLNTLENSTVDDTFFIINSTISYLRIISRDEWRAKLPTNILDSQELPIERIIIAQTFTEGCSSELACSFKARTIQTFHMDSRGWSDIGYNFLIGGDGNVYEGRGWLNVGAHTKGYNINSVCIAFIGTYSRQEPSEEQLETAKQLINKGVELEYLSKNYTLYPQNAFFATESPGAKIYAKINSWPNFSENFVE